MSGMGGDNIRQRGVRMQRWDPSRERARTGSPRSSPPTTRRIGATGGPRADRFPAPAIWAPDAASGNGPAGLGLAAGPQVVARARPHGKGANVTAAAGAARGAEPVPSLFLLCDGDLGASAAA